MPGRVCPMSVKAAVVVHQSEPRSLANWQNSHGSYTERKAHCAALRVGELNPRWPGGRTIRLQLGLGRTWSSLICALASMRGLNAPALGILYIQLAAASMSNISASCGSNLGGRVTGWLGGGGTQF